jgi:hypothetical protein
MLIPMGWIVERTLHSADDDLLKHVSAYDYRQFIRSHKARSIDSKNCARDRGKLNMREIMEGVVSRGNREIGHIRIFCMRQTRVRCDIYGGFSRS